MAGLQDYQAREFLFNVLKERGISLGSDEIAWAFASSKTRDQIIAWVKEYCQEETLLSSDELALLESGAIKPTYPSQTEKTTPVIDEQSLKHAIEALNASTLMMEKHIRTFEAQKTALEAFKDNQHSQTRIMESPQRTLASDVNRNEVTLEDSVASFKEDLQQLDKQASRGITNIQALVNERLRADDNVLAALALLAPKTLPFSDSPVFAMSKPNVNVDQTTIDQWCQALILLRESEINSRLDSAIATYLFAPPQTPASTDQLTNPSLEEAENELASLRTEIPSVLQLLTESTLRKPLIGLLHTSRQQSTLSQREWLHYVIHTLEHMVGQLDLIGEHTKNAHAFESAVAHLRREFLATSTTSSGKGKTGVDFAEEVQASVGALQRARSHSNQNLPMHTRNDSRASIHPSQPVSLTDQVMKRFNISPSSRNNTSSSSSNTALSNTTAGQVQLLHSHLKAATSATADALSHSFAGPTRAVQDALEAVYAQSSSNTVRLAPVELESDLEALDKGIHETVEQLGAAGAGKVAIRRGKVAIRRGLVERIRGGAGGNSSLGNSSGLTR